MIKTVFLDLDDTLLDFKRAEKNAVKNMLAHFGIEPEDKIAERYAVLNSEQWQLHEKGILTLAEVKVTRYERLIDEFSLPLDAHEATACYEDMLCIGHFFMPGAEEMLKAIYKKYDLYLASNGTPRVQRSRIKSSGMEKYLKNIFISGEIGFNKPDTKYFEYCFSRVENFSRETAVMIGDRPTSDIKGGNDAGIRTIRFNPRGEENPVDIVPTYEVKALAEIPSLLEKI